jgi:hypothetical protein
VLAKLGFDAIFSFHIAFMGAFLLFGLSVYYFARSVGSDRTVSVFTSVLAWSTNAYWNIAIWGGAYNRAFTVPFMIFALGTTYRFVSRLDSGRLRKRDYWFCLGAWTLTYLGDVFLAIAGTAIGLVFLLLSASRDNFVSGLKRIGVVIVPACGLVVWKIMPVLVQSIADAPYRTQYTGPNDWNTLLVAGSTWTSTLNFVLVPLVLVLTVGGLLTRVQTTLIERALLISLFVMGTYWLVMGWVPPLWPYLPRLMSTNSSIENLAWIFLMALPMLLAVLIRHFTRTGGTLIRIKFRSPLSLDSRRLVNVLRTLTILFIVVNALIVIPSIRPVNWGPLYNQLNVALNSTVGAPSGDYRISLENRVLTRTLSYYQPNRFDTGGRVEALDPNPFFNSWYMTDVFYKNDLSSINANYVEDRPPANVSSLLESPYNFAGEKFWLDWYGVSSAVFYPYSYLYNTIGNYSIRSSLFSVTEKPTSYLSEWFVSPLGPSPILIATNASLVGFYSSSENSGNEYQSLVSMLSAMGLSSRFVVPLYLHSIEDASTVPVDLLVTDSSTYSLHGPDMQSVLKTSNLAVVSSEDGQLGVAATVQPQGTHFLTSIPVSFSQLVSGREAGAYYFVGSAPIVVPSLYTSTSSLYYGATTLTLAPTSWTATYATSNVRGVLQSNSTTISLNVTSLDTTSGSQLNIDSMLPNPVPISNGLMVRFTVRTTANITLGVSLGSNTGCCASYVAVDKKVGGGNSVEFQLPYSEFKKWGDSNQMFGVARDLTFAINLPSNEPSVVVRLTNVSVASQAYTISDFPKAISLSDDGVLSYNTLGATGVGMLNKYNASTVILNLSGSTQKSIMTIASLSGGESNAQYDKIIIVGASGQPAPMLVLFTQSPWSPVHETWSNNENMISSSVPQGFRGVVWKETYSSQWRFEFVSGGGVSPLLYYYAGPGMIYVPLANGTGELVASFMSTTLTSVAVLSASVATIASLVVLRNKLPRLGLRRGSSGRA